MPTFQEHQQRLAQAILGAGNHLTATPLFAGLIDALPYFRDPRFDVAHRGALANLLEINLPNNAIEPEPSKSGFGYSNTYTYTGPYHGYRDAFFGSVPEPESAKALAAQVTSVNSALGASWWGDYGLAVLTDAIRSRLSVVLDTSFLSGGLSSNHQKFLPALTASVLAVVKKGFAPTQTALGSIAAANQTAAVCAALTSAIEHQQFTTNSNEAIAMGGDSASAAVWFLYQLWITLMALGAADVDGAIARFQSSGLTVPPQVGPRNFWNGGYTSWYTPLAGSDVMAQASPAMAAAMPERVRYNNAYPPTFPDENVTAGNGYAYSLCSWGPLARYVPGAASCFGAGTGVLMADGSVKPIEQVQIGEVVRSSLGPKRVVLIETPKRNGRPLYRVNDLEMSVTMAHPLRTTSGPARVAVDAWALLDCVPTALDAGVGLLRPGVTLSGQDQAGPKEVPVSSVTTRPAGDSVDELVYDLLLEAWENGQASYYVGGPSTFVAADPETVDPLYSIPLTTAVVTAMEAALAACREHVPDPWRDLSLHVGRIPIVNLAAVAHEAVRASADDSAQLRPIPPPEFYMKDGAWDAHASALESLVVRHFSRRLRREIKTGWRNRAGTYSGGNRFAMVLHDIELMGDAGVPAGALCEIELRLQRLSAPEEAVQRIPVAASDKPKWHIVSDRVVDFGAVDFHGEPASLIGTLIVEGRPSASFRASVMPPEDLHGFGGAGEEHFLFDASGNAIGRIAFEQRRTSAADLEEEQRRAAGWRGRQGLALAVELGRKMGQELAARVAPRTASATP